jgi:hypothetical protein
MVNVRGFGRLGMLAVGLGIGAAVAHSPVASADSSTDWLSSIDGLLGGAVPALSTTTSDLNLSISFDGYQLINDGSAFAGTVSGQYGLAIAYGANSEAIAGSGTGNFALADGSDAGAYAGDTGSGNNFNTAIDIGTNNDDSDFAETNQGSYDTAIQIGNNTGIQDGPFAGDGDHDTAIQIGSNTGDYDGVYAEAGSGDSATQIGSNTGTEHGTYAEDGNSNTAIDDGNYTGSGYDNLAGNGNDNFVDVVGNQSEADAGGVSSGSPSDGNVAYVLDPTGTDGSTAEAGGNGIAAGGYDLAAVLGVDDKDANATGAQFLYDIVTALGNESGTAASTGGGLLGELFGSI